jgi:hypothetical protein
VGTADSYFLTDAVYFFEAMAKALESPRADFDITYGDRAEHCWNGDHTRPNALSRLRYAQMFLPKGVERILKTAPAGADTKTWRY